MPEIYQITPVNSISSLRKEVSIIKSLADEDISFTLADRTVTDSKSGHYFSTFNIPYEGSIFLSGSTMARKNPEMYQLNVDKIVVISISENNYSEYIDGRSLTLKVPQSDAASGYKTIVSSFYNDDARTSKLGDSPIQYFGAKNVSFLFSDDINLPYTGTTGNGTVSHSTVSTWNPTTNFRDRPSAVGNSSSSSRTAGGQNQLITDENSDARPWSTVNLSVSVNQSYPRSIDSINDVAYGYNYDIPVGFVCLDKGFIVLTHPDLVNNIPWTSGSTSYEPGYADSGAGTNVITGSNSGATSGTSRIVFTGMTSTLSFEDISIRYVTSIVCIAMPGQFFISQNPTWPLDRNLAEISNNTTNFDSIFVSQIGLYNVFNELIAVAKTDRPIEKTYDGLISFNLEIDI